MKNATQFRTALKTVIAVLVDVNIMCVADKMYIEAVDSSHVALVSLILKPEFFTKYECQRPITIGVNITELYKTLNNVTSDTTLVFSASRADDRIHLSISNNSNPRIDTTILVPQKEINVETLTIPGMTISVYMEFAKKDLSNMLKMFDKIGCSSVQFNFPSLKHHFRVSGCGGNMKVDCEISYRSRGRGGRGEEEMDLEENGVDVKNNRFRVQEMTNKLTQPMSQSYSLSYILRFIANTPSTQIIKLYFGKETPLRLTYTMTSHEEESTSVVSYYLAPQMDE